MIESTNIGIVLRNTMCWQGEVESDFWGVDMWKKQRQKPGVYEPHPARIEIDVDKSLIWLVVWNMFFFHNIWDNPSQLTNSFQDD